MGLSLSLLVNLCGARAVGYMRTCNTYNGRPIDTGATTGNRILLLHTLAMLACLLRFQNVIDYHHFSKPFSYYMLISLQITLRSLAEGRKNIPLMECNFEVYYIHAKSDVYTLIECLVKRLKNALKYKMISIISSLIQAF